MATCKSKNIAIFSILSILFTGCAGSYSRNIYEYEISKKFNINVYGANLDYSELLINRYFLDEGKASKRKDLYAMFTIGLAAAAAGGAMYGAHVDYLKGVGLTAGTSTAIANYFNKGASTAHLQTAVSQLICVVNQGRILQPYIENIDKTTGKITVSSDYKYYVEATGIIRFGIQSVRLNLRKSLNRKLPDYGTLVNTLQQSALDQVKNRLNPSSDVLSGINVREKVDTLRTEVTKCVLLSA